ncbi:hypothetical protein KR222_009480 [Zaprionus bogoriensis]|nr:hypothetical protein KR222_009480 [Zaprionus bogoriensis]
MYLDTKNLASSGSNPSVMRGTTTTTATVKSVRRIRKVWQPLRRLLTVGGNVKATPLPHPNNVDLNNTQVLLPPLDLDNSGSSKTPTDDSKLQAQQQELLGQAPPPPNTPTLISSVFVEKAATPSCNACQHGRNCQHTHHRNNKNTDSDSNNLTTSQAPHIALPTLQGLPSPLQYISTDNGTFFWSNTQDFVDDDLLQAWLCRSFSQLPGTLC